MKYESLKALTFGKGYGQVGVVQRGGWGLKTNESVNYSNCKHRTGVVDYVTVQCSGPKIRKQSQCSSSPYCIILLKTISGMEI